MKEETKLIISATVKGVEIQGEGKSGELEFCANGVVKGICTAVKRISHSTKEEKEALYMALLDTFIEESGIDFDEFVEARNAIQETKKETNKIKQKTDERLDEINKKLEKLFKRMAE